MQLFAIEIFLTNRKMNEPHHHFLRILERGPENFKVQVLGMFFLTYANALSSKKRCFLPKGFGLEKISCK